MQYNSKTKKIAWPAIAGWIQEKAQL